MTIGYKNEKYRTLINNNNKTKNYYDAVQTQLKVADSLTYVIQTTLKADRIYQLSFTCDDVNPVNGSIKHNQIRWRLMLDSFRIVYKNAFPNSKCTDLIGTNFHQTDRMSSFREIFGLCNETNYYFISLMACYDYLNELISNKTKGATNYENKIKDLFHYCQVILACLYCNIHDNATSKPEYLAFTINDQIRGENIISFIWNCCNGYI